MSAEVLAQVFEANFERRNEEELTLLAGHLLLTNQLTLDDFWKYAVTPLFVAIEDLVLDMPFLITSFVVFFEKLIGEAKVIIYFY